MVACTLDYYWARYVIAALVSLFGGVVILLPIRLIWQALEGKRRRRRQTPATRVRSTLDFLRTGAEGIVAGNSTVNKIIMSVFWLADVIAVGIYLAQASMVDVEKRDECGTVVDDALHHVWVVVICVSCVRFVIKLVASTDRLMTWIDMYSIVDHFTIVPTFVGIYYDTNWIGLRFFRLICLLNTPDLLQLLHIIKSNNHIRIAKALSLVLVVWVLGAGMYFLLENNGDPFHDYENNENKLPFWDSFYFVLITMTTIGYGDISPKTVLGKAFTVVFVVAALGFFATLVPELAKALSSRNKYRKAYKGTPGRRHIIICGGITFETLTTVVKNFIHEDAAMEKTDIVIIDINKPSGELQAFFRRHFNNVTFIQGTVLDIPTLKLAKAETAEAVLILANSRADDEEEDAGNIMRVTALKNLSPDIRIILQLLQHDNKEQLLHIPGWSWHQASADDIAANDEDAAGAVGGDEVICLSELKMGFMAQNCLAPGIVTMLSNLICMRSYKPGNKKNWMDEYCYGAAHEIYAGSFSKDFIGLTFTDAVDLCLTEFGVLLVAVSCPQAHSGKFRVNPGNSLVIRQGHIGFFIAQGPNEVRSVANYQKQQRSGDEEPLVTVNTRLLRSVSETSDDDFTDFLSITPGSPQRMVADGTLQSQSADVNLNEESNNNDADVFDGTSMFHWRLAPSFDSIVLDSQSVRDYSFSDHVIFVLCAGSYSHDIGLDNFVRPLRTSSLLTHRLRDIIFYTDPSIIKAEWEGIANFPKLYVYPRSKSINIDLRLLGVQKCAMCLVLGPSDVARIDNALVDNRSILTTKNILSLRKIEEKMVEIGVIAKAEKLKRQLSISHEIPMLIELEYDASVAYIDDDDEDDPSVPVYQTMPYVCGKVLLASVLDSLVAATYMNSDVPTLIRALLTGGEANELENLLTKGVGLVRRQTMARRDAARRRSSLTLLNLSDPLLASVDHEMKYLRLVRKCLRTYGLLCLGVYRLLDAVVDDTEVESLRTLTQKRYVITHPLADFRLIDTDKIYALKPFEADIGSVSPATE